MANQNSSSNRHDFSNKIVLVTGGNRSFGKFYNKGFPSVQRYCNIFIS